jgi:polysaccharide chain length determinant protein (PEP-CTERM system associated)
MLPGREPTIDSTLKLLRRGRWLVIGSLYLGVLGGLLYSWSQPSLYRSDAVIQVVPQRVPESYVSATVTERVEDRLRAIAQQVISRTQLEKLILEFNLFPDERRKLPMEDVVELMTERITIQPLVAGTTSRSDTQSEAFRVSFDYQDPATTQKVTEKLASFFVDTNARERGAQAEQTSLFLEAQLADARGRLEAQEAKLKVFRESNAGRLPTQTQTNMQAIQSAQLALQAMVESLARNRDRKLMLDRLYSDAVADQVASAAAAVSSPDAAGTGDIASRLPADGTPQQRLEAARRFLSQIEVRLSPKHPDVMRVRRFVDDLERQVAAQEALKGLQPPPLLALDEDQDRPVSPEEARRRDRLRLMKIENESIDRQIAFQEGEERRLRDQIGAYQARLEASPGIESEWVALSRDYDTLAASYRELLSKAENSKMAASLEQRQIGEQFRVLDAARVPQTPRSPNRIRINLTGTFAGLGAGLLLVGLGYFRDSTMRSEADLLGAIELPVLAILPFVTTDADLRRQKRRRWIRWAVVVGLFVATGALVWILELWRFVV